MKCNYVNVQRAQWQREAIEVARKEGIEQAKKICDRESEDVIRRCFNLVMIAAKQAGLSARKCKEIQNNLERYVVPTWERMVNSDDNQIGKGVGDFWARDELKAAGYPYYLPTEGEM